MQVEVGDRLVIHGKQGTRIGLVTEVSDTGWVVRWADGVGATAQATWEAAKASPAVSWRRGVTAGVGHEASLRQAKLARDLEAAALGESTAEPRAETAAEAEPAKAEPAEHPPAVGE